MQRFSRKSKKNGLPFPTTSGTLPEKKVIFETGKASSPLSDEISKDLKKRGMKFIGTTIVYAYLQSVGIIYSHDEDCFLFKSQP